MALAEMSETAAGHGGDIFERHGSGIGLGPRHEQFGLEQAVGFEARCVDTAGLEGAKASLELLLIPEAALDEGGSRQLLGHHAALGKGGNELVLREHPQDEQIGKASCKERGCTYGELKGG